VASPVSWYASAYDKFIRSGKPSIGVGDYLPFTETKEIVLREDCVMFTYIPDNEMITGYKSNFDSEELPDKANIVPFTRK